MYNIYAGGNYITFVNTYIYYEGDTITYIYYDEGDRIPHGEGTEYASI